MEKQVFWNGKSWTGCELKDRNNYSIFMYFAKMEDRAHVELLRDPLARSFAEFVNNPHSPPRVDVAHIGEFRGELGRDLVTWMQGNPEAIAGKVYF